MDNLGDLDRDLCFSLWFEKIRQGSRYQVLWQLASTNTDITYLELSTKRSGNRITLRYTKQENQVSQNIHFDLDSTIEDGQWHYLLLCLDYPDITLYLDGVGMRRTIPKPLFDDNPNSSNAELRLGSPYSRESNRFVGNMGQVYLFQGANLTTDHIQCLTSCGQLLQFPSSPSPSIVGSLDKWRRTLILTGDETTAFYEAALQAVYFKAYGAASATVTFQVRGSSIVYYCCTDRSVSCD